MTYVLTKGVFVNLERQAGEVSMSIDKDPHKHQCYKYDF